MNSASAVANTPARLPSLHRSLAVFATLTAVLVVLVLVSSANGAVRIPFSAMPHVLFGDVLTDDEVLWRNVLMQVRLPRVLLAVVAGAGLTITGTAMQALFRNPLAEPGLIGISSGGALGAVAAIVLGAPGMFWLAPAAFIGSLLSTAVCYQLGSRQRGMGSLLLAGVAINVICGSMIGLFTYMADDAQLRSLTFWNMGSLAGATWSQLAFLAPWTLGLSLLLLREWRALNALLLGEREAQHLGFALKSLRRRLIVLVALIVGPLVAATGVIGFVGLVVPHLVRLSLGADHRWLLPNTLVAGAIALSLADWLARIAVVPAELPIGIVTSLVGGPFFLWMLTRKMR
ncbi:MULTISPECIES: FecCD family ABC transporter permease [Silvimonas]|uniref:FecCD family ABC transporter permease n=1 Tax=Silvimonas TaxID=300264 RepID=UPI0024B3210D|nr:MULTISPECIES: iron ABC transporter permease [Silvimonas]MDR3428376.1 iron ABC transporter permease [Silvimonas sp.]